MTDIVERLRWTAAVGTIVGPNTVELLDDARAEILRLRAALEWRPIETAPKDGKLILATEKKEICVDVWGWYCNFNQPKFTNWLPLPSPPESQP